MEGAKMETNTTEPATENNHGSIIVFGSLAVLYLLLCLCLGGFIFFSRQGIPALRNYFPTPKALRTLTPTPVVHIPAKDDVVIESDFSDNTQSWQSKWQTGRVRVANGHLSIQTIGNVTGIAECEACRFAHEQFYIEAELSSTKKTNTGYGIAFNISSAYGAYEGSYYLFQINAATGRYFLYKFKAASSSNWMLRLSKDSDLVKAYPQTNKLGVAFNKDTIELYLNGIMVESYQDPGTILNSGRFGFFVDNSDVELNIDNLFSYGK
jgi:hypothetical protein